MPSSKRVHAGSLASDEAEMFEVERVIGSRISGGTTEYQIRWKGFGESEDTWEPEKNLSKMTLRDFLDGTQVPMFQPNRT